MSVELIYDPGCPNVEAAREALLQAFSRSGRTARWTEWEQSAPDAPEHVRGLGSPTILVDGEDVAAAEVNRAGTCRLYPGADGLSGVPPVDLIAERLDPPPSGFGGLFTAVPAAGAFLVPVGFCPACWPAYGALLGSLGLGFLLNSRVLVPFAGILLLATLAALAHRASRRRGYGPLIPGIAGSAIAALGKLVLFSDPVLYLGLTALLAAAIWNAWPRRPAASCPRCVDTAHPQRKEISP